IRQVADRLHEAGIDVALFIDPEEAQIHAARDLGVSGVELHTGRYADALNESAQATELRQLTEAGSIAIRAGLLLHMGHGLTYRNVVPIARISGVSELNIGHSIISRAILVGLERAVREMKQLMQ
ncbi:MAG: pyridoxine 5'-phosphate synthase, partial [Planctomycetaceae bacterium]